MIKIYKCPGCGFNLTYDGKAGKMVCSHCGRSATVEEVAESSLSGQNVMTGPEFIDPSGNGIKEMHCPSCGVTLLTSEDTDTSAVVCPACQQSTLIESRLDGAFRPKYLIPFAFDKKQAKDNFKSWARKGRLTPNSFKTDANLDKMKGVYVPAWFYTYTLNMAMTLEAEKTKTVKKDGTETITKDEYLVELSTAATYERVPCNADQTIPHDVMEVLEPYDYAALTEFALPYLSGFFAEKYHFTADEFTERVKEALKDDLEEASKAEVTGYDEVREKDVRTEFTEGATEYVLLPVWMLQYEYGRKKYPLYMNGQTGEIDGKLPVSRGKVLLIFGVVFAVVLLALILLGRFCS